MDASPTSQGWPLLEKGTNRETNLSTFHLLGTLKRPRGIPTGQAFSGHLSHDLAFPPSESAFLAISPIELSFNT